MSNLEPQKPSQSSNNLRKLPFTHGIEVENFITNKRGDILEDGKELVAVWDQMFNGALNFFKSLTSSSSNVPGYIRNKIKGVTRKDVERHGKIIRYVQMQYQFNGRIIAVNIFGPDPNISQITWLLELVTPPCEYIEELDWWINTLYIAASQSITSGYYVQPLGFNPYQTEYRAGVTCGEHHHLGGFKNEKDKKSAYNMIRAYIPHLIALSSTSPFVDGKPNGRIILKKGDDGRTLILAPDCVRSIRLKENSGQLGPNIPEYLPHVGPSFTQQQFSRYVRKEIPDDRYVDAYPFTTYGTIECRFFDAQFDQNIRMSIILLLQALALKGVKFNQANTPIPEIKGNTLYEHRKRAVNYGMFAKFQGDPGIESTGGIFAKYYNHNPENGGPPGKIYESLRALLIWLKPELRELNISEREIQPLLIMLWGTARIAPPISTATFLLYLFEQNHNDVSRVINSVSLLNGKPRKIFSELLGQPEKSMNEFIETKAARPVKTLDTSRTSLARSLQQDSRKRRKENMAKERARLKAKQMQVARVEREKVKKERELEKKRLERVKLLEKAKKAPPKPSTYKPSTRPIHAPVTRAQSITPTIRKPPVKKPSATKGTTTAVKKQKSTVTRKAPTKRKSSTKKQVKTPVKKRQVTKTKTRKPPTRKKSLVSKSAVKNYERKTVSKTPTQAYASTTVRNNYKTQKTVIPKPTINKRTRTSSMLSSKTKKVSPKTMKSTTKTAAVSTIISQEEFYKDSKFVRNISIHNFPNKCEYPVFIPSLKINWKRSILQSMISLPIKIEAEFFPMNKKGGFSRKVFHESLTLDRTSLRDFCYLPIPIDIGNYSGDFKLKFVILDGKTRKPLATANKISYIYNTTSNGNHAIRKLTTPPNKAGDSFANISVKASKRNLRGKITIFAFGQRGIMKLYEKKARFNQATFSLDLPITIPLSICSSSWYLLAIFNAKGSSASMYTKVPPPLSTVVNLKLLGNPPLKTRVKENFQTAITPKMMFKTNADIREIDILQIIDNKKLKVLKRYHLKTRIKKGENFVLESFDWKTPSMRKGLFGKHKQRNITFHFRLIDNVGIVNDSLVGLVETPTITVFS
ncbi:MAG TPA: glutamate-cysteine ligase family protein [candidate division Zixibacteria bacterium]|nr:glutamate-cysteine ligase family protein [candidate division Zixibacteria bacterium]